MDMKQILTILFSFGTLLAAQDAFCLGNASYAEAEELTPQEAADLAYLWEEEKHLRDIFLVGSECSGKPEFASAADAKQEHMDLLKMLLHHYGMEVSVPGEEMGVFSEAFEWEIEGIWSGWAWACYPGFTDGSQDFYVAANAVMYGDRSIWNLLQAMDRTDKQRLLDAYNYLLVESCAQLRLFVSYAPDRLGGAQFVSQDLFYQILAGVFPASINEGFTINAGLNDAWYYPESDGQGFFVTVFPDRGTVSLAWFTYDTVLPDVDAFAYLGDPGQRWLIAHGAYEGTQATLNVKSASGGLFDTSPPEPVREVIGTVVLQFEDCNTGSITYDLPTIDKSGVIPIERIAGDNIAACEAYEQPALPTQ
jgi:hypothetical protein